MHTIDPNAGVIGKLAASRQSPALRSRRREPCFVAGGLEFHHTALGCLPLARQKHKKQSKGWNHSPSGQTWAKVWDICGKRPQSMTRGR